MAFILNNPNRRQFVKTLGLAGLGVMAYSNPLQAEKKKAHIALLSDTHIPVDKSNSYRGFYPYKSLQKAVPQVISSKPNATIISGDLARLEGFMGDYKNLEMLLNPLADKMPVALALGNHDNRDNFELVFSKPGGHKQDVKGKHVVVMEHGPVRIIILDSLLYVNRVAGLLGKAQRQWLQSFLQSSDNKPTFLVVHHAPTDNDNDLLDMEQLFRTIKNETKVKALFYGHSHAYKISNQDGIHLINLPAVAYNFNDNEPIGWVDTQLSKTGGLFTLKTIGGNETRNGETKELVWR